MTVLISYQVTHTMWLLLFFIHYVPSITSKNLVVKSTMFPHRNIHKYTWTSTDGKTDNQIDHILIDRRWHSSVLDVQSFRELIVIQIIIWSLQRLGKDWQWANRLHRG